MRALIPSLLLLASAGSAIAADTIGRDALGPRTIRLTYEARVEPAPGTERVELWLPLPREENQAVRELKLSGSDVNEKPELRLLRNGESILGVTLHINERLSGREKVRRQMVAAGRVDEIACLIRCL